jgi:hypothetical protein
LKLCVCFVVRKMLFARCRLLTDPSGSGLRVSTSGTSRLSAIHDGVERGLQPPASQRSRRLKPALYDDMNIAIVAEAAIPAMSVVARSQSIGATLRDLISH